MTPSTSLPVTQRAYTLRLRRAPGKCPTCGKESDCACWREALWATHEAVNKGAKAFGDWLLTLRGGLDHTLADVGTPEKRRNRRVLLALSWLSVEDERGAPDGDRFHVATGMDPPQARGAKVTAVLRGILKKRGIKQNEIESWLDDCKVSLEARIREDAAWVNRSLMFDDACRRWRSLNRDDAREVLTKFFDDVDEYLSLPAASDDSDDTPMPAGGDQGADFRAKAREWVSTNLGTGEKSDKEVIAKRLDALAGIRFDRFAGETGSKLAAAMAAKVGADAAGDFEATLDSIWAAVGWKGRPSKGRLAIETACRKEHLLKDDLHVLALKLDEEAREKEESAGRRVPLWVKDIQPSIEAAIGFKFVTGRDLTGEFSTMLDHAARRVSIAHSWIKRAEQRRRKFEEDAKKLEELRARAPAAVQWLDEYCRERSVATGAGVEGGYRIRKRAVGGWDRVVKSWAGTCKTKGDRISAAREVQDDPEIEKFGDIQLFESLAVDDAVCVWQDESGTADSTILTDYVKGKTAEHDQRRFKVPAYRHPDPLLHPVFCDFGNSRWAIEFACHEAAKARNGGRLAKKNGEWVNDSHGLRMGLWDGRGVRDVDLRWASKRLTGDLALGDGSNGKGDEVTRADRLGRAASDAFGHVKIMSVFEEDEWNGRLQAPRAQLDRIAWSKPKQAEALRQRLRWLVSFSPRLKPSGPFIEYAAAHGIEPNRKGDYYPNAPANKGREGLAKLVLSRLPGLRVLSVDLGLRFGAACTVWEALSPAAFKRETAGTKVRAGGAGEEDLYLHVEKPGDRDKPKTIIYRRIGSDRLSRGAHPAPWARLDRQFLIKLQGEREEARKASPGELERVNAFERSVGRMRPEKESLPTHVDRLMSDTVRTARLALRRHGDRARIAFNLTTEWKPAPGGGRLSLDRPHRVELLTETLALWHGLFNSTRWADPWAAEEWRKRGLPKIEKADDAEDASAAARKAGRKALEESLRPQAERLADRNLSEWSRVWAERWKQDDAAWSGKEGHLLWLKRWIAPRGLRILPTDDDAARQRKEAGLAAARGIGGLSTTRIDTITGLYQLHKAFKMRPEPDDPRKNVPQKGDDELADFNRRLLDMRDRLREQRVKQLASRIVEAALGVGREHLRPTKKDPEKKCWCGNTHGRKDPKRPRGLVHPPCHAVVIESLEHYRPDDLRTRRENRQLMQWSSAKVQKYLREGCQLYGLHLREVSPNYTSRQDSRTGLPGVRCEDVPVEEFLGAPWWNKITKAARDRVEKGGTDAEDRLLKDISDRLSKIKLEGKPLPSTVRVPRRGGDLFVAAPPPSCRSRGHAPCWLCNSKRALQADLNAAANIGLRALMDPDWPGRWWYVPCDPKTFRPAKDRVKGCAAIRLESPLKEVESDENAKSPRKTRRGTKSRKGSPKDLVNLWRDPSAQPISAESEWHEHKHYWNGVRERVVDALKNSAGKSR